MLILFSFLLGLLPLAAAAIEARAAATEAAAAAAQQTNARAFACAVFTEPLLCSAHALVAAAGRPATTIR